MSTCRRCGRDRPLITGAELPLLALLAAVLFAVLAYQAGFEAGAASAVAALDTYAP